MTVASVLMKDGKVYRSTNCGRTWVLVSMPHRGAAKDGREQAGVVGQHRD